MVTLMTKIDVTVSLTLTGRHWNTTATFWKVPLSTSLHLQTVHPLKCYSFDMDVVFMTKIIRHDSNHAGLMVVLYMPVVHDIISVTLRRDNKLNNVTRVTWYSTKNASTVCPLAWGGSSVVCTFGREIKSSWLLFMTALSWRSDSAARAWSWQESCLNTEVNSACTVDNRMST